MIALKLFSSILFSFASAATLPQIPTDCFDEKNYCTKTTITGGLLLIKVISITFFAQVSADDYPTANSIMDLYLDFKRWPEYTASSIGCWHASTRNTK